MTLSPRARALAGLTLALVLATLTGACGDAEPRPAPGPAPAEGAAAADAAPAREPVPLDGPLVDRGRLEQAVAAQIFWRRLREAASDLQIASLAVHADAVDPAVTADLEKVVRRVVLGGAEVPGVALERVDLPPGPRRPRITAFLGERYTPRLESAVLHPASPPAALDQFGLWSPSAGIARPEAAEEGFGFLRYGPVSYDELERARAAGAGIWVCAAEADEAETRTTVADVLPVAGRGDRTLPIPVVHFDPGVSLGMWRAGIGGVERFTIRIEVPPETERRALVLTMRGEDDGREIVVCCGRATAPFGFEVGSRAVNAAALVEMARVFRVTFFGARAREALPVTVRFVWVLDESAGWSFLDAIATPGRTLLGVIDLDPTLPRGLRSDVVLAFHGIEAESFVERAALSGARDWAGQAISWHTVAVTTTENGPGDELADRLGQLRIPAVTLAVASTRPDRALAPSALRVLEGAPTTWPPAHEGLHGSANRLDDAVPAEVPQAVALARLAAIAVVRAAFSAVGEAEAETR